MISSLHEVSGQSVKILRKEILSEINLLDGISNEISEKRLRDPKKLAQSFQKVTEKYQLSGWASFLRTERFTQVTGKKEILQTENIFSQG